MSTLRKSVLALTTLLLAAAPLTAVTAPAQADTIVNTTATKSGLARAGDIKVTLVTVKTADKTVAATKAINLTAAKNSIATSSNYWRTVSNGRLTMSVSKTIVGFNSKAKSTQNFDTLLNTVTKELKWVAAPNSALVLFIPRNDVIVGGFGGNYGAGWASGATSGRIVMPYTSGFTAPVMTHEFGHVLGMNHANSLQCNNGAQDSRIVSGRFTNTSCSSREYGDSTDLMGVSQFATPYLNSVLFDEASMGRGDEIRNLGVQRGVKSYTLTAWAGTGANRAVKFTDPISKEVYYVQLRLPVGYDASKAWGGNRGVEILKADRYPGTSLLIPPSTKPFAGWYNSNHAWQAGSTFTTATGFKVKVDYINDSSAGVTIHGDTTYLLVPKLNAVAAKYNLGAAVGGVVGYLKNGGAYQQYQRGAVYYSPATGARVSKGAIRSTYQQFGAQNGVLGYPTSDEIGGLKNGGIYQTYQGGRIIWTPTTGARILTGAIAAKWDATGGQNRVLGYPTSNPIGGQKSGGVYQMFQGGGIYWSAKTGARLSTGAIRTVWGQQKYHNGVLGYPTSDQYATVKGGIAQDYQGGKIVYTSTTGARILLSGTVSTKYFAVGGYSSALGFPVANELRGLKLGGSLQAFQNGSIAWSSKTGVRVSTGNIHAVWVQEGAQNGYLGYPTTDEVVGLKNGGSSQSYQGGVIVRSVFGTYISKGAIRTAWLAKGAQNGILGYPKSNEYSSGAGTVTQDFEGGKVVWTQAGGATVIPVEPPLVNQISSLVG